MIFDILPGWTWWIAGAAGVAVLVLCLVWAVRKGEEQAQRECELWVREQLAQVIARRTGVEPGPLYRALQCGDANAIPADLEKAELRYERLVQPSGGVRRSLVVHFRSSASESQISTAEEVTEWSALPPKVRAEMIRTGQAVTRAVSVPARTGLVQGGR